MSGWGGSGDRVDGGEALGGPGERHVEGPYARTRVGADLARAALFAGLVFASVSFAQGERPKKQSFVPEAQPALQRPKSKAPAPALTVPQERRAIEQMTHEKRLEMIRMLEDIIELEQVRQRTNPQI